MSPPGRPQGESSLGEEGAKRLEGRAFDPPGRPKGESSLGEGVAQRLEGRPFMTDDVALRPDLMRIASWIVPGSKVLDLGCGDGALLAYLAAHHNAGGSGIGVEIDAGQVVRCVDRGVDVIQQNLEDGLALFEDQQFDTVVLSQTLQSMRHTEHILREMARVARQGIVSVPNFGYWPHGWSILAGRMPVGKHLPYQWYDTPNIHLCTLQDFERLAEQLGLPILDRSTFHQGREIRVLPGWRATLGVYRFASPRSQA